MINFCAIIFQYGVIANCLGWNTRGFRRRCPILLLLNDSTIPWSEYNFSMMFCMYPCKTISLQGFLCGSQDLSPPLKRKYGTLLIIYTRFNLVSRRSTLFKVIHTSCNTEYITEYIPNTNCSHRECESLSRAENMNANATLFIHKKVTSVFELDRFFLTGTPPKSSKYKQVNLG